MNYETYIQMGCRALTEAEFDALYPAAKDVLSHVATKPLPAGDAQVERAVLYQVEMLAIQGGREALGGRGYSSGITETLGDYSVGYRVGNGEMNRVVSFRGIPISGLALAILRRAGLTSRAVME